MFNQEDSNLLTYDFWKKIQFQLQEKKCKWSTKTIQGCLFTEFGLKSHKLAQKPRLTEDMKKNHLNFFKAHAHWTIDMWKKVFFFDESLLKPFKYSVDAFGKKI